MLLSTGREKEARSKTDKGTQDTGLSPGTTEFLQYNPLFFKPHNKLEMKTQKEADATYKSTKIYREQDLEIIYLLSPGQMRELHH